MPRSFFDVAHRTRLLAAIVAFAPVVHAGATELDWEARHGGSRNSRPPAQPEAPPIEEPSRSRWYGWQTLIVDGAALTALPVAVIIGDSQENLDASRAVLIAGLVTYLNGAPMVHFAHNRVGIGFASLGLRLTLPIVGAGLAAASCTNDSGELGCLGPALLGITAGIATTIVLDAAVFSYEKPSRESTTRNGFPLQLGLSLQPKRPSIVVGLRF